MTKQERAEAKQAKQKLLAELNESAMKRKCGGAMGSLTRRGKEVGAPNETTSKELLGMLHSVIGSPCKYCGKKITLKNAQIDHVLPLSRGGKNETNNLEWICQMCNRIKGELTGFELRYLMELDPIAWSYLRSKLSVKPAFAGKK